MIDSIDLYVYTVYDEHFVNTRKLNRARALKKQNKKKLKSLLLSNKRSWQIFFRSCELKILRGCISRLSVKMGIKCDQNEPYDGASVSSCRSCVNGANIQVSVSNHGDTVDGYPPHRPCQVLPAVTGRCWGNCQEIVRVWSTKSLSRMEFWLKRKRENIRIITNDCRQMSKCQNTPDRMHWYISHLVSPSLMQ